jgi:hypothetical protein
VAELPRAIGAVAGGARKGSANAGGYRTPVSGAAEGPRNLEWSPPRTARDQVRLPARPTPVVALVEDRWRPARLVAWRWTGAGWVCQLLYVPCTNQGPRRSDPRDSRQIRTGDAPERTA